MKLLVRVGFSALQYARNFSFGSLYSIFTSGHSLTDKIGETYQKISEYFSPEERLKRRLTNLFNNLSSHQKVLTKQNESLEILRATCGEAKFSILDDIDASKVKIGKLSKEILRHARLVEVTQKSSADLKRQLFENERVHPTQTQHEFEQSRLGLDNESSQKSALALVVDTSEGRIAIAAIFRKHATIPYQGNQTLSYQSLPGHVLSMKQEAVRPQTNRNEEAGSVKSVFLYSVSSRSEKKNAQVWGAGSTLIKYMAQTFNTDQLVSTVSPLMEDKRGSFGAIIDGLSDYDVKALVLSYLSELRDSVAQFHLGNGAYIGDIHINRDDALDSITINYVYPADPEVLGRNGQAYRNCKVHKDKTYQIPISGLLEEITASSENSHKFKVVSNGNAIPKEHFEWRSSQPVCVPVAA